MPTSNSSTTETIARAFVIQPNQLETVGCCSTFSSHIFVPQYDNQKVVLTLNTLRVNATAYFTYSCNSFRLGIPHCKSMGFLAIEINTPCPFSVNYNSLLRSTSYRVLARVRAALRGNAASLFSIFARIAPLCASVQHLGRHSSAHLCVGVLDR